MAAICHYYPGITPLNVYDIEYDLLQEMVRALGKAEE